MIIDYNGLARASTAIHAVQGAGLLVLGAAEAYAADNPSSRAPLAGALALLAAAAAAPLLMLALAAGWDFPLLKAVLDARRGFYLFIAFSSLFAAAGLSRITQAAVPGGGRGWQFSFLFFLAAAAGLYFLFAWRVNEAAWRQVLALHAAIGVTLALAVAAKAANIFSGRRWLHVAWGVLLLTAGAQLLLYRETPAAFGINIVTFQASPDMPGVVKK